MGIANFLGTMVGWTLGGLLQIYLFQMLWEFTIFKRVMDDPVGGKLGSTIAAYFTAGLLYGVPRTIAGPFEFTGFLLYLPSALIIGYFAVRRGVKIGDQQSAGDELHDTFS